jgi:uncharacterized protein YfaP (DUF2135 family)
MCNAPVDLDLHLVTPDGTEVYKGNVNSWQRAGGGPLEQAIDVFWRQGTHRP